MVKTESKTDARCTSNSTDGTLLRVLMVDDDSMYRQLCRRFLAKDPENSYHIVGVASAEAAIDACQLEVFDCIIVDYLLPDSLGTDVIADLELQMGEAIPPVVILTAGGGEEAATHAVRANAADFLSKRDVSSASLCRSIKNAIEKSQLKTAIRNRNKELSVAYTQLQQSTEEIKNFYHTISHEVKTPLTALREFLSIITDEVVGPITEEQRELLGFSLESCDQISEHFNDLIDLARLETGKLRLKRKMDSSSRLIKRCIAGVAGIAAEQNITITDDSSDDIPDIDIDSNRIAQVVSNLLNNAIKHTEAGGCIRVNSVYESISDCVFIRVSDSGCGIEEQHLNRIFDRLYQVDPKAETELNAGLGLGLSIAREVAQLHGGELLVESQHGEGSTFILRLPVAVTQNLETNFKLVG
jgi:two-component system sensor histidine kinase/response regulator